MTEQEKRVIEAAKELANPNGQHEGQWFQVPGGPHGLGIYRAEDFQNLLVAVRALEEKDG